MKTFAAWTKRMLETVVMKKRKWSRDIDSQNKKGGKPMAKTKKGGKKKGC